MNNLVKSILVAALVAGCSWTPERLNPYDPNSAQFVKPPTPNSAPVVDTVIVNTNCVNFPTEDQCGVKVAARIIDSDNNLDFDQIIVTIKSQSEADERYFGQMLYNPIESMWELVRQETELDSAAERYVGSIVTVHASDDSGAVDQSSVFYPNLFRDYPSIHWPKNPSHCICPDYRYFTWGRWNGEGQASEMEIRFYYANFDLVPSLTVGGISPSDTSVWVDRPFFPSDSNNLIFYGWRLFVVDQNGNRAGSESGTFNYRETCTASCGQ